MNAPRVYIPGAPPAPTSESLQVSVADLLRVLDAVPLRELIRLANTRAACPSPGCPGQVVPSGPQGWFCRRCCSMGGPGAYWLMLAAGWTRDELQDALDAGAELEVRRG